MKDFRIMKIADCRYLVQKWKPGLLPFTGFWSYQGRYGTIESAKAAIETMREDQAEGVQVWP